MARGKPAIVLVFTASLVTAALGQTSPRPSGKDLADITARGILLEGYDQAAWHASDAVQETHPSEEKVRRYIARKTASGWIVDFGRLNSENDKFLAAYETTQTEGSHFNVRALEPVRQDAEFDLVAAKAMDLALKDFGGANRPYNVAVLPASQDALFVYVYPAQVKDGVYPYGGDVRYLVSADGANILIKRPLHKSVLESIPGKLPKGTTPSAGYHTHILTDRPEDTDVFLVLSRQPRVPEFVGAGGHVFEIAVDGKITIVK